jgi:L-amino acid N-acyltransferase YncA
VSANVRVVVTVREATDQDWPAIYPFFAEIVAAGRTYAYPLDLSSDEARALWMERPPGRTFVAVDGDRILGSAKAGPNRPGRGAHVSTASFMVDPNARARGVGRALAEHVLAWATAEGYRSMQFNAVVETNESAVRLWQALGFRIIGTVPAAFDDAEHGRVGLHVMFRELADSGG